LYELAACGYRFTQYRPPHVAIRAILVALDHKIHTNITGKQRQQLRAQIEKKMGVTITGENAYDIDIRMCETHLSSAIRTSSCHAKMFNGDTYQQSTVNNQEVKY
jgi:hypothetical protein